MPSQRVLNLAPCTLCRARTPLRYQGKFTGKMWNVLMHLWICFSPKSWRNKKIMHNAARGGRGGGLHLKSYNTLLLPFQNWQPTFSSMNGYIIIYFALNEIPLSSCHMLKTHWALPLFNILLLESHHYQFWLTKVSNYINVIICYHQK